jgi:hypothetical protein
MAATGLNPELVRDCISRIESHTAMLAHAQIQLQTATAITTHPVAWAVNPGNLVLSGWSVTQAATANAEIGLARASARELLEKLAHEVGAQLIASSDVDGLYESGLAWRTDDAQRVPDVEFGDFFDPLAAIRGLWDAVETAYTAAEGVLETIKKWSKPGWETFVKWWDDLPDWAGKLAHWGKLIPVIGGAISTVELMISIDNGDWLGIVHHGGALVIDVVTAFGGGWIGAAVGIGWDVVWMQIDNAVEMIQDPLPLFLYYQEVPWMAPIHFLIPLTADIWGPLAD